MPSAAKLKTVEVEPEFLFDIEQQSADWWEVRRGLPTASEFATILSDPTKALKQGKTPGRQRYLYQLAGELLQGEVNESYTNYALQRGKDMEPEAIDYYARTRFVDVERVGFVRRKLPSGRYVGCSPDGLVRQIGDAAGVVGSSHILQVKTMRPDLMLEHREMKTAESLIETHKAQVQGELWVTGWDRADLLIYYRNMPFSFCFTVERDEAYIAQLAAEVARFDAELHAMVERNRK
jgi:hypothetical protein